MSLEISFKPNSSARPRHLSLQDGESIQVFSGESFQIQNTEIVAQLVPQDKDLQIVCHDGTSFILKNFLKVEFAIEPTLTLQDGASMTWHNFVRQTEGIDQAFNFGDTNNLAFAPLLVIAATAESPEWTFAQAPISEDESPDIVPQPQTSTQTTSPPPKEDPVEDNSSFSNATYQNIDDAGIKLVSSGPEAAQSTNTAEAISGNPDFIEIDVRRFLDIINDGTNSPPAITGVIVGDEGTEIEVNNGTGIATVPKDIFDDNPQVKLDIIVDNGGETKNTIITITETKDGGGETFHLILSQNQVSENQEGALIGKLDTDDAGRNHTYEYTLSKDSSNLFEIEGNVLKLKDGISIDYEAHPESYPVRIVATDETGHKIEQSMDIWPRNVNEAASVSSIDTATLEDVRVSFDPKNFDAAFDDEDNDYLEMVRIDTLPENGILCLGDDPVSIGQLIHNEQIKELSFQPNVDWNGDTEFQWSGFDGGSWTLESSTVSISIEAINDAPFVSVNIGQKVTGTDEDFMMSLPEEAFVDVDSGDTLSYSAKLPSWLNIDSSTGTLSGVPSDEHIGDQDITITATDSSGESTSQTFRLTVESTNDAPTVIADIVDQSTNKDTPFTLDTASHFNDVDMGDSLTYSATLERENITGTGNVDSGTDDDTITASEESLLNSASSKSGKSGDSGNSFGASDGDEGTDILILDDSDFELDFTSNNFSSIQNIETLNIDGSGANSLKLNADDVLDTTDSDNKLFIDGGTNDSVEISSDYSNEGTESVNGINYNHYYDSGTDSHLYINSSITDLDTF